jgi:hypothetical protein
VKKKSCHAENAKTAKENLSGLGDLSVKNEKDSHAENAKTAKENLSELGDLSVK